MHRLPQELVAEINGLEDMGMPVSTFGRLVNGSSTLKCLCYAVTDEEGFKGYLRLRSKII